MKVLKWYQQYSSLERSHCPEKIMQTNSDRGLVTIKEAEPDHTAQEVATLVTPHSPMCGRGGKLYRESVHDPVTD